MNFRVSLYLTLAAAVSFSTATWAERPIITSSEHTATKLCKEYDRPHSDMIKLCEQAIQEFDHTEKDRAILLTHLGYALEKEDQVELGIENYSKAIALNPTYALPLVYKGWAHWQKEEHDKAIAEFEKAFQLSPNAEALGGIASSISHKGESHDLALEKIDQALLIEPKNIWNLVERAWIMRRAGRFDEAIQAFEEALTVDSSYPSAHYGLALGHSEQENWEVALASINNALKQDSRNPRYLSERSYILRNLDRPAQALRDANAALEEQSDHKTAIVQKGWSLIQLGRTKEAIETLKTASQGDDESNYLWFNYADILSEDERWDESLDAINHALTLHGSDSEDLNFKSYVLLKLDRNEEALKSAKLALDMEPTYRWALINAAYASVGLDDTKSAYSYVQDAIKAGLPKEELSNFVAFSVKERKFLLAGKVSLLSAEEKD